MQAKLPPWERGYGSLSAIERGLVHLRHDYDDDDSEWWIRGWAELRALQAVAEAAEAWDANSLEAPQLRLALKKWRAICPR